MTSQLRTEGDGIRYYGLCYPAYSNSEDINRKALDYAQKIVDRLNIRQGPFNMEYISNGNDVFILDIGQRNGGMCMQNLYEITCGAAITEWTIKSAVGDMTQSDFITGSQKPALLYFANSSAEGLLERIEIDEELKDKVSFSLDFVKKRGACPKIFAYFRYCRNIHICL